MLEPDLNTAERAHFYRVSSPSSCNDGRSPWTVAAAKSTASLSVEHNNFAPCGDGQPCNIVVGTLKDCEKFEGRNCLLLQGTWCSFPPYATLRVFELATLTQRPELNHAVSIGASKARTFADRSSPPESDHVQRQCSPSIQAPSDLKV